MDNKERRDGFRKQRNHRSTQRNKRKKKREWNPMSKKCGHCGCEMRTRGASDAAGGLSWKCRNKKCGRTVWEHRIPKAPIPLVPASTSYIR